MPAALTHTTGATLAHHMGSPIVESKYIVNMAGVVGLELVVPPINTDAVIAEAKSEKLPSTCDQVSSDVWFSRNAKGIGIVVLSVFNTSQYRHVNRPCLTAPCIRYCSAS